MGSIDSTEVEWLELTTSQYRKVLDEADHFTLLQIVAEKYKLIGDQRECGCEAPKNEKGQCEYDAFHEKIGKQLREIANECHKFHTGKEMKDGED